MKQHIRTYHRRKHGRASHGGNVNEHFRALTGVVEMSQGRFEKKPKLIVKPWNYATNHLEETPCGDTTKASVIIDKKAMKDKKLVNQLMLHELRENQLMQRGLDEPEAHAIASSFGKADAAVLGTGDVDKRAFKVYKGAPKIFTDRQLNKLSGKQMFGKSGRYSDNYRTQRKQLGFLGRLGALPTRPSSEFLGLDEPSVTTPSLYRDDERIKLTPEQTKAAYASIRGSPTLAGVKQAVDTLARGGVELSGESIHRLREEGRRRFS